MKKQSQNKTNHLAEFAMAPEDVMKEALIATFENLSPEEKSTVEALVKELDTAVKSKHPTGKGFGIKSELELLAKTGLWLKDNGYDGKNKTTD